MSGKTQSEEFFCSCGKENTETHAREDICPETNSAMNEYDIVDLKNINVQLQNIQLEALPVF